MTTVGEIIQRLEQFAPPHLAESWDPIGLAFGSKEQKVERVLVALDLDANTLQEAKEQEIDFIFTHHPTIFSALKTLNEEDPRRREFIEIIRSNMALYSAHTNIDAADEGMNDWLAKSLDLKGPYDVLDTSYESDLKLLVLYTPYENAENMRQALHQMGAGQVGDYKDVSYTSAGKGHFIPGTEADPTIGESNQAEEVEEERAEILFPSHLLGEVLQTIHDYHPYEEPVYHLLDIGKKGKTYGIGRVGSLAETQTFADMIKQVKEKLNIPHLRYANGDLKTEINKVAILGGSGEKYYGKALAQGADLYVTGDISYHGAQDMIRDGLLFIDAGHFIENIFVAKMTEKLKTWNEEEGWGIKIIPATTQEDVFRFN